MTMIAVVLPKTASLSAPIDASTYFLGADGVLPTGTEADHAIAGLPLAGTVRAASIFVDVGTVGTGELVDVKIRNITGAASTKIASDGFDADGVFVNADVGAALGVGDQWCIEISTLAWGTNPSNIEVEGVIYIEDDAAETVLSAALVDINDNSANLESDISDIVVTNAKLDLVSAALDSDISDIVVTDAKLDLVSAALDSDISDLVVEAAEIDLVSAALDSDISDIVVNTTAIAAVSQGLLSDISALVLTDAEADTISANLQSDISDLVVQAASQVSDYAIQSGLIAALGDTSAIEAELDLVSAAVVALDLDAAEIVTLNALLAENPPGILSAAEVAAIRSKVTTKLSGDAGTAR